jgi:3'(2'), 5'-bisphosphate nucleotidase
MTGDQGVGAVLADMAEAASGIILPLWRTGVTVHVKADDSPVTEADRRGEAAIIEALARAFPDVPVVAEEHSAAHGLPATIGPRFFLVDAVDGTKAFVRGEAHFSVNIALIEDGRPVAGAVAAPALGQVWFTAPDGAAKRLVGERGGAPIRVRPPGERTLALTSHSLKPEQEARLAARYGFTERQGMDSSLKLCVIAEGGADLYPRHGPTMEWDIAAAHAILAAAGGSLTTPEGEPFLYGKAAQGFENGWFVARGG